VRHICLAYHRLPARKNLRGDQQPALCVSNSVRHSWIGLGPGKVLSTALAFSFVMAEANEQQRSQILNSILHLSRERIPAARAEHDGLMWAIKSEAGKHRLWAISTLSYVHL